MFIPSFTGHPLKSPLWALTDEDGYSFTAGAHAGAGDGCHLHLVPDAGQQPLQHRGEDAPVHRLVDVVPSQSVVAQAPNL